ncbi:tetratricopeptide repeat protein [Fictibacillus sp. KU28468]|uniref:tetratricopeptide repeat protein n=1 Tax=Fictibacillus sp. KU28468 TaxID=2991053 RepID=UPI00223E0B0A|nr:hypothetical protein [Fictibacillus sp. KU28468]UZJ80559.1 hypothetical protein OKX00_08965 [Fictibacillus sp. KU28468]
MDSYLVVDRLNSIQHYASSLSYDLYSGFSDVSNAIESVDGSFGRIETSIDNVYEGLQEINYELYTISNGIEKINNFLEENRKQQFKFHFETMEKLGDIENLIKNPNETESKEKTKVALDLIQIDEYEEGISLLFEAIKINPMNAEAHFALMLHFNEKKQNDNVLEYGLKVLKRLDINKSGQIYAETINLISRLYLKKGEYESAFSLYQTMFSHHRGNEEEYYNAVLPGLLTGKVADARTYVNKVIFSNQKKFGLFLIDQQFEPVRKELNEILEAEKKNLEKNVNNLIELGLEVHQKLQHSYDLLDTTEKACPDLNSYGNSYDFSGYFARMKTPIKDIQNRLLDEYVNPMKVQMDKGSFESFREMQRLMYDFIYDESGNRVKVTQFKSVFEQKNRLKEVWNEEIKKASDKVDTWKMEATEYRNYLNNVLNTKTLKSMFSPSEKKRLKSSREYWEEQVEVSERIIEDYQKTVDELIRFKEPLINALDGIFDLSLWDKLKDKKYSGRVNFDNIH